MFRQTATLMLFVAALPAAAQTASDPTPGAPVTKAEKQLCRTEATTGSIMGGKRICHTKADWATIDQRNNDNVSAGRDLNGQGGNRQGGGGFN